MNISFQVKSMMTRMRISPKIYDYCYVTTSNNLYHFKEVIYSIYNQQKLVRVLDVGCGNKPFSGLVNGIASEYIGVDISSDTKADVIQSIENPLPYKDDKFGLVIISEALEHVTTPYDVIKESFRVLEPGGYLYISTPFAFPIHGRPYDFYRYTEYFYREVARIQRAECLAVEPSNTIFSTPIYIYNQVLMPIPGIPLVIKNIFYVISNIVILSIDNLARLIFRGERFKKFTDSFPAGYAVILRKNQDGGVRGAQ